MHIYLIIVLATHAVVPLVGYAARPSPHWDDMRLQHSWSAVPEDWEYSGPPPTSTTIDLYVALMPRRKDALIQALNEVSSPGHPKYIFSTSTPFSHACTHVSHCRYGAYLSREQVADLVAPHSDTLKLVHSWLEYCGVPSSSVSVTHGGSSLKLTGVSTSLADVLLGASYQSYRHAKTNETIVRTLGYALPTALGGHVQTVAPTTSFDSPRKQGQKTRKRFSGPAVKLAEGAPGQPVTVSSSRDDVFGPATPAIISWLYGTWDYSPLTKGVNRIGFVGFLGEYPSERDLTLFMQSYHTEGLDATFTVSQVNGGVHDRYDSPNIEADMNMQYSQGMSYPTEHIFYSSGRGRSGTKDYYSTWLEYILEQDDIPRTISIPYANEERSYSREYAEVVCNQLARLGTRGISVLVPSGDSGVGGKVCYNEDVDLFRFVPNFPASCTCGFFSLLADSTGSLTTRPRFRRSLCHFRWRNEGLLPRGCSKLLQRRLLELLFAPGLPAGGRVQLPSGRDPREPVRGLLQVRSHP